MNARDPRHRDPPSLGLAVLVSAGLVVAMAWARFLVFPDLTIPLSDAVILLVALWHRDLRLLWATFAVLVVTFWIKFFLVPPDDAADAQQHWLFLGTQILNVLAVTVATHLVVRGRERRDSTIGSLSAANRELEEREERINRQNEELQAQAEELEQQAEELASGSEEIQALNEELGRREASLQVLLASSGPGATEGEVLRHLCEASLHLVGGSASASAILERTGDSFRVRSWSGFEFRDVGRPVLPAASTLAAIVLEQGRTGAIPDLSLRPDIRVPLPAGRVFRSILSVPIRLKDEFEGALEIYGSDVLPWSLAQFRLAEWIADQASRVWEASRLREERSRLDAEVTRQRDFLKTLVENLPMAVAVVKGPAFRFVLANPSFCTIPSITGGPVVGRTLAELFPEATAPGLHEIYRGVLATGRPSPLHEFEAFVGPAGEPTWWSGEILRLDRDSLLILALDVTEQVRALRRLRENESRYRTLSETLEGRVVERTAELERRAAQLQSLAAEITNAEQRERARLARMLHDHLQQLLVAAKLKVGLLSRHTVEPDLPAAARDVEVLIAESIQAVRTLTAELSPLVLRDRGLVAALEWLARWMRDKYRCFVETELDEEAEPVSEVVRVLLFEAARELLLNVVKHAGVSQARVVLQRDGADRVRLVVEDEGAGFDPATLHGAEPGTGGFGLLSVRERLDNLGGRVGIESGPGLGTRISLSAPVRLQTPSTATGTAGEPAPEHASGGAPPGGSIRVLLADDHEILRQGIASLLALEPDIEVVAEASNGLEALELANRFRPDVVVMDVTMPILDGVEATRRILGALPHVRVIGLSLHENADMARSMRDAGAVSYLNKGGPADLLVDTIRKAATGQGLEPTDPGVDRDISFSSDPRIPSPN